MKVVNFDNMSKERMFAIELQTENDHEINFLSNHESLKCDRMLGQGGNFENILSAFWVVISYIDKKKDKCLRIFHQTSLA